MLKRRSTWVGGTVSLILILCLSGLVAAAEQPVTEPVVVVDTTARYEDLDGNGIDDDCQDTAPVVDGTAPATVAAESASVDADGNGVISQSEAAHSPRTGGTNCNHGGYVSWMAHQEHESDDDAAITGAKKDKVAAAAAREASKAQRALARDAAKAERALARDAAKAERALARDAAKAERIAARDAKHAERQAAKAARTKKGN